MENRDEMYFSEWFFPRLESNEYLKELHVNLLKAYTDYVFGYNQQTIEDYGIDLDHLLTFVDLLSKSTGTNLASSQKLRALEIIEALCRIFPWDNRIKYMKSSVLAESAHFLGLQQYNEKFVSSSILDDMAIDFEKESLQIPGEKAAWFFPDQKKIISEFGRGDFSFSAPTSMGKTFLMKSFIKSKVNELYFGNFAILLPTRALINEVSADLTREININCLNLDYKIVTTVDSILLNENHNFVFIVTPERMLYILLEHPEIKIHYLFVDEAYKLSAEDKRSAYYYKAIEIVKNRNYDAQIIFASPNIPNPEVYLETAERLDIRQQRSNLRKGSYICNYSPVVQFKFLVDFNTNKLGFLDPYENRLKQKTIHPGINDLFTLIERTGKNQQNLVYCASKNVAITNANNYYFRVPEKSGQDLIKLKELSKEIKETVHEDYYLSRLVLRGVAYHIGYLPAQIRVRIEELYKDKVINTIFCTSTLLEGVNLPADNLYITSYKKGLKNFTTVDFRNLVGRIGRASLNLSGNVFVVSLNEESRREFQKLLTARIEPQKLSLQTKLTHAQKEQIVQTLLNGEVEIQHLRNETYSSYDLKRKTMLILLKNIMSGYQGRVFEEFQDVLQEQENALEKIIELFSEPERAAYDDINISYDQANLLSKYIREGGFYPDLDNPDYQSLYRETVTFLKKMGEIFKWDVYEKDTLGAFDDYHNMSWYAVLLLKWMQGKGLNQIIKDSIRTHKEKKRDVYRNRNEHFPYHPCAEHNNYIIADTLEAIEEVLLFRLSNYFLKFSEEYRLQNNLGRKEEFQNDWYEYIQFGTNDPTIIFLQKVGYSRESAALIKKDANRYIFVEPENTFLSNELLDHPNKVVKYETETLKLNIPEIFR